jgi:aminoglycoside phosphotransferase (APT) family kinase protein
MPADAPSPDRSPSLLRRQPPQRAIDWAVRVTGASRAISVEPLPPGNSHANHVVRLETGGSTRAGTFEVVLRRLVRPNWQEEDPEFSPAQEAATYELLASSAVPTPRLVGADPDGTDCDVPALLLARAPGTRPNDPQDMGSFLTQLAEALPQLHAIDPERAARTLPPYRPYYQSGQFIVPVWTRRRTDWERAIEVACRAEPAHSAAFIHRDYHPGNTLWSGDRLTAIVDWTTASWGPPEVDLTHMRVNLAALFGLPAADRFLDCYGSVIGRRCHIDPYWDLCDVVDFATELPAEVRAAPQLARLDEFVARALARL